MLSLVRFLKPQMRPKKPYLESKMFPAFQKSEKIAAHIVAILSSILKISWQEPNPIFLIKLMVNFDTITTSP